MSIISSIGQVIGKVVGVLGTVVTYGVLQQAIAAMLQAGTADPNLGLMGIAAVGAFVVWSKAIVPFVDAVLTKLSNPVTAKGTAVNTTGVGDYIGLF